MSHPFLYGSEFTRSGALSISSLIDKTFPDRGANKSALKRAFMKSANNRMKAKPLLNKFISMVA